MMKKVKITISFVIILLTIFNLNKILAAESTSDNFTILGTIQIPKTGIKYPILEQVSTTAIETGISKLYGPGLNKVGNTVLIGHNYRNDEFFSKNKNLVNGDAIYITDSDNVTEKYVVYNIFETTPEDTSFYTSDSNGDKIITLTTSTDDSRNRIIVQARSTGVSNDNIDITTTSPSPSSSVVQSSGGTNNTNTNTSIISNTSSQNTNTTTKTDLPKAGRSYTLMLAILVVGVSIIVFYVKKKI